MISVKMIGFALFLLVFCVAWTGCFLRRDILSCFQCLLLNMVAIVILILQLPGAGEINVQIFAFSIMLFQIIFVILALVFIMIYFQKEKTLDMKNVTEED